MRFNKDSNAVLDYRLDWSQWLPGGDTITTSTWTATPNTITVDDTLHTPTTATVWLSGGTTGVRYQVTNHITTAAGREDDRTLRITIKEM